MRRNELIKDLDFRGLFRALSFSGGVKCDVIDSVFAPELVIACRDMVEPA